MKLTFFILVYRLENLCFNLNHILGDVILQLMDWNVNWSYELELLLSVFEFLFDQLDRDGLKIDLNVFRVMNELLPEHRLRH